MKMIKLSMPFLLSILLFVGCQAPEKKTIDTKILASLGDKHKKDWSKLATEFEAQLREDSTNIDALLGLIETEIIIYVFGFSTREETLPIATQAFQKIKALDSMSSDVYAFSAILNMLNWKWDESESDFIKAIAIDTKNLRARHWYSLYLSAMGKFDKAMSQSDTIGTMDPEGSYMIGRGSLLYFARKNEEMKKLMIKTVAMDTTVAWGYDWLGMAYVELEDFENSLDAYDRAFELSDGTVEVGAGFGHALGLAGEYDAAKQMADYYTLAAKDRYLPPVQRAFVHIGIGEYEYALNLLEQAYSEQSWFLIFMRIEPWYDPIRKDKRFTDIIDRMKYPNIIN